MISYATFTGSFAAVGSFSFGFDTGIITTSIAHQTFKDAVGNPNAALLGAIVSTYIAGEVVGAAIQIAIGDKYGRKRFMEAMSILVVIGSVLQTATVNYAMFIAGRVITGIGIGGLAGTAPVFNAEVSPPGRRGFIGGLVGQMIVIGSCLANWIGFFCGYAPAGQFQWRFPLSLQIPPGLLLLYGLIFVLPESPRWLATHGRFEEAEVSFRKIRTDLNEEELVLEFEAMKQQLEFEKATQPTSLLGIWRRYRKRVLVSVLVQSMTSAVGINVINYYQTNLYKSLGVKGQKILLLSAVYGTVGLIANLISVRVVDRFGRVQLMRLGTGLIALFLLYTFLLSKYFATSDNQVGKSFAILGIYLFTFTYYGCLNSTTWLYGSEVVPMFLRSKVMGLASLSHFAINVGLTQGGPSAFANIGPYYYLVFVGTASTACLLVHFFAPETANISLEAIAELFGDELVPLEQAVEAGNAGSIEDEEKKRDIRHIE